MERRRNVQRAAQPALLGSSNTAKRKAAHEERLSLFYWSVPALMADER
jgi:hypothetical protein